MAQRFAPARAKLAQASELEPSVLGLTVLECAAWLGESRVASLSLRQADTINARLLEAMAAQHAQGAVDAKVASTASLLLSILRVDYYDVKDYQPHGLDSGALLAEVMHRPRTTIEHEMLSRCHCPVTHRGSF